MCRVVITGVGAVTPLGNDAKGTWEALLAGRSGVDFIEAFDPTGFPVKIAAEVKDYDATGVASPKDVRRLERNVLFALSAAREALADAGGNRYRPERVGVVLGSCIGGVNELMRQSDILRSADPIGSRPASSPTSSSTPRAASSRSSSGSAAQTTPLCPRALPARTRSARPQS